jgi:ribosomal protein S18 acetylase RimI-like enzyme
MGKFKVISFDPRYVAAFIALNREWIETYFRIEEMDIQHLENFQSLILDPGGEIFFILEGQLAIGTCAMVPHGHRTYEIAKMAVSPAVRGRGAGDLLMKTAIEWSSKMGADSITLLSNTVLEPAISLYKKHGFQIVHLGAHPDYERCNIEMKLVL